MMVAVKFRKGVVYWQNSAGGMASGVPALDRSTTDWHGVGLRRHDVALQNKISRLLRKAPKKHDRRYGSVVSKVIFPMAGVSGAW